MDITKQIAVSLIFNAVSLFLSTIVIAHDAKQHPATVCAVQKVESKR